MDFNLVIFLKGLVIGMFVAVPVGPIGVLCIRRTLVYGRLAGLASGMGAATADAAYAALAALSLQLLYRFIAENHFWLATAGGLVLCGLGGYIYHSRPRPSGIGVGAKGLLRPYLTALALTLANPVMIFLFLGCFAALRVACNGGGSLMSLIALVGGVFLGSTSWWVLLGTAREMFGMEKLAEKIILINRAAGVIIFAAGVYSLLMAPKGCLVPAGL